MPDIVKVKHQQTRKRNRTYEVFKKK